VIAFSLAVFYYAVNVAMAPGQVQEAVTTDLPAPAGDAADPPQAGDAAGEGSPA
jgi:hypothetical protein